MDADEYWQRIPMVMPLIAASLVAIFGLITFAYQKSIEKRLKYRTDVQERYEKYLHSIFDALSDTDSKEKNAKFQQARVSLRLYASPEVLISAKQFEDHVTGVQRSSDPKKIAAVLLNSMRNHVLPGTWPKRGRLSNAEMENLNSFNVN